jgi:hypothetical protein
MFASSRRSQVGRGSLVGAAIVLVVSVATALGAVGVSSAKPPPPSAGSLAALATDPAPWLHLEANSLQRSPVYLGSTPRELALGLAPVDGGAVRLPATEKSLAELQMKNIYQSLQAKKLITASNTLTVESWPVRDDRGRLTWAYARWRVSSTSPWRWLRTADTPNTDPDTFAPYVLDPTVQSDHTALFGAPDDYGWYVEPDFGDSIWVRRSDDPALAEPIEAWLPNSLLAGYAERDLSDRLALVLPPPARLNGKPITFNLVVKGDVVTWPSGFQWTEPEPEPGPTPGSVVIDPYPLDFASAYRNDVLALDGEAEAVFPISGRVERFTVKNNALPDNQLAAVFEYLEERYELLGLQTWRQDFVWRGMPQTNLVAVIPGTDRDLPPLVIADHVDTAFDEDLAMKGIWMAVPGADDNSTGSAAVLRAADVLRDRQPQRTIWLVHFTGEEFPADDLGARALVSAMLADREDIYALLLIDMIGFAGTNQQQLQLSAGNQAVSLHVASVGLDAAADVAPELAPLLRMRYDDRSYLYNTDGIIFSENGYPVVLFNEYLNYYTRLMRAAYHDMSDTSAKVNFDYAVAITKVIIETAARECGVQPA